jgi:hypothetical protein
MRSPTSLLRQGIATVLAASAVALVLWPSAPLAQATLEIKPVAEKKLKELPTGPLYWRLEAFATLGEAQGAAGPTSLAAEVAGKTWLFLAPKRHRARRQKVADLNLLTAAPVSTRQPRAARPGPRPRTCIRVPKPSMC